MTQQLKQFSDEYSSIFQDASVVAAYCHRPPYPTATFEALAGLIDKTISPVRILDAGCGTGQMASGLRHYVDAVDAVDISAAMIVAGKQMPHGSDPRINWLVGGIEAVELRPPYGLIVAAASLHWMPWEATLPRFARVLSQNGYLAIVENGSQLNAWDGELKPIFAEYSMNRDFQPYNMLTIAQTLEERGLFQQIGVKDVAPVPFCQSIDAWVESFHARNGFSRDRMGEASATEFDQKVRDIIGTHCPRGEVEELIGGRVIFGKPLVGPTQ